MPNWVKGIISKNQQLLGAIGLLIISSVSLASLYAMRHTPATQTLDTWQGNVLVPANADETPLPFVDSILWHPAATNDLALRRLGDTTDTILTIADGIPVWWDVATTRRADAVYHLIWRTENGSLQRTLIDPLGNLHLAVIDVAENVQHAAICTSGNGWSLLAWLTEGQLSLVVIDVFGRPLSTQENWAQNVDDVAVFPSLAGHFYIAWLQNHQLFTAIIDDPLNLPMPTQYSIALDGSKWAEGLHLIGVDDMAAPDVLWLIHPITNPTQATLAGMTWDGVPLSLDGIPPITDIDNPRSFEPAYELPALAVRVNDVAGWMRWDDQVLHPLEGPAANLSAPRLWFDAGGNLQQAAWTSLDDRTIVHYITYPQTRTVELADPSVRQWLNNGLENAYQALGWLLFPLFLSASGYVMRDQLPQMAIALGVVAGYLVLKMLLSPSRLYTLPPQVDSNATIGVGALLLASGLISIGMATAWFRASQWGWPLVVVCIDAVITLLIFGGNLS